MAYHNILSKNDRALVAYLVSKGAGTDADVYPAKRSQDKELPNTVCYSEEDISDGGGNSRIKAAVLVKTSAITEVGAEDLASRLASDARVSATGDALMEGVEESSHTLAAAITTAARTRALLGEEAYSDLGDYTCLKCNVVGHEAAFDETGAWVDTFNLDMVAAPSNVS
jgi:hypothetical protein